MACHLFGTKSLSEPGNADFLFDKDATRIQNATIYTHENEI